MLIIDAVTEHKWVLVAALVIGATVRAFKSGYFEDHGLAIPQRARPWVALALGIVSGVLNAIVAGEAWKAALTGGVVSALLAMSGHDLLVESLLKGQELLEPTAKPSNENDKKEEKAS